MNPSASAPSRLSELLEHWSHGFAARRTAPPEPRAPLVPHLAAAADLLLHDAWCSLNLAKIPASRELVRARAAKLFPPGPDEPWPAPDPTQRIKAPEPREFLPGEIDPLVLASLDGYLACQQEFKHTVVRMLQDPDPVLPLQHDLAVWYLALMQPWTQAGLLPALDLKRGRTTLRPGFPLEHTPPAPEDIPRCLQTLFARPHLIRQPGLVHLAVLWIQPWTRGNGRMARLIQGALFLAGGRPWPIIPGDRRETYLAAIQTAFDLGISTPLASLLAASRT